MPDNYWHCERCGVQVHIGTTPGYWMPTADGMLWVCEPCKVKG
jgi:hypothetical protein